MALNNSELQDNLRLLRDLGVDSVRVDYFIESKNDSENDDIISLVDDLSSKMFWFCTAYGSAEMKRYGEAHLDSRRKLIEKIKEIRVSE